MTDEEYTMQKVQMEELKRSVRGCCWRIGWLLYKLGHAYPVTLSTSTRAGWLASEEFTETMQKVEQSSL